MVEVSRESKSPINGAWITIGAFDGIHLGHQKIINYIVEGARQKENNFHAIELWWYNDPRYTIYKEEYGKRPDKKEGQFDLEWVKNKGKQTEIRIPDELWSHEKRRQMIDDGWEATSSWFDSQVRDYNGDDKKLAQEILCSFLGSGNNFINEEHLKRIEEERLIQLHHAKSKLYTNITHEFRTPLTVILGMADEIENDPKGLLNKGVSLIKSNANKLLKLVNQLLTMSKLEADSMPINLMQSDIIPYVRYILESLHSIAEEKNIRLHFLSEIEELTIDYDPEIIEEIISNLISNAIKYTPNGGDVYLKIGTQSVTKGASKEELIVQVRDNGTGIAEDQLPYIFNRFYQVDDESTRKAEGTGIGLALIKEYIHLLKGTIQVKSSIDKGTEFIIKLPVTRTSVIQQVDFTTSKKADASNVEPFEDMVHSRSEEIKNKAAELPILIIIEDNSDVVEYLNTVLQADYHIEVANDGDLGIALALQTIPDIIICDVMMPKKDGYEVCKTLKDNFRTNHIPIIMLTAKADIESKISGLEFGADAYITKPFDKRELLVRIDKLIETRQKLKDKFSDIISSSSNNNKPKGLNEIFLHNLLENLGKNYHDERYGIDQLCMDLGISRTQLHRKLIALTGKTTSDFIRHYRIKKAKEFLLDSDITVSEIAYQVGFKDPNYFTKSFAKDIGMTPSQYRSDHSIVKQ